MSCTITQVEKGSPAERAGIKAGARLISINDHIITDVLDYTLLFDAGAAQSEIGDEDGVQFVSA